MEFIKVLYTKAALWSIYVAI